MLCPYTKPFSSKWMILKLISVVSTPKPRWNPGLAVVFRKKQASVKKVSSYPTPTNYNEFKMIQSELRSMARKAKWIHRAPIIDEICASGKRWSFWCHINGNRQSNHKTPTFPTWSDRENRNYIIPWKSYLPIGSQFNKQSVPAMSLNGFYNLF